MGIKEVIVVASVFLAWVCFIIAGVATPFCVVTAIYSWGVSGVDFQFAAGAAVILWLKMFACVIPGLVLLAIAGITDL